MSNLVVEYAILNRPKCTIHYPLITNMSKIMNGILRLCNNKNKLAKE